MKKVMVYCSKRENKVKLFHLLPLLKKYNFFFLDNSTDFSEDFSAIKPEYLIMEYQLFELVKKDQTCLSLISECPEFIIIKHDNSDISLPFAITPSLLSPNFSINDLSSALISTDYAAKKATDLRIENEFLQMLMDNIPDTIYFKDKESRFTRVNNAKAMSLRIEDPEEAIGKTDGDFFNSDRAKKAYEDEQNLMMTRHTDY